MNNKIAIIGGPGCGKTTLANKLSKIYNIPVTNLDALHYLENWQIRNEQERDEMTLKVLQRERWIIDGTYPTTLQKRLEAADLIIWLDYSTIAQIKGILKRYFRNAGKEKVDILGCKERLDKEFFKYTLNYRKNKRCKIADLIIKVDKSRVKRFTNKRSLNRWIKSIENVK